MAKTKLRKSFLNRTTILVIGAFSLVAALAWNDAIQNLFKSIFGELNQLWAKFIYALAVTLIAAIIVAKLEKYQE